MKSLQFIACLSFLIMASLPSTVSALVVLDTRNEIRLVEVECALVPRLRFDEFRDGIRTEDYETQFWFPWAGQNGKCLVILSVYDPSNYGNGGHREVCQEWVGYKEKLVYQDSYHGCFVEESELP